MIAASRDGEIYRDGKNGWRWFARMKTGMVAKIAGNATVVTMVERGWLKHIAADVVIATDEGRACLVTPAPARG